MVTDTARPEQKVLKNLDEVLDAIKKTDDPDEIAMLLVLVNELFADSECVCEGKLASYGEGADEALVCLSSVSNERLKLLEAYKELIKSLKEGGK